MAPAPLAGFALDNAFPHLKNLIVERTGHFYYVDKEDVLWERVRKRLRATGNPDCASYLGRLGDPILGPTEWARLEAEITIGETFFFRYVEQFNALRDVILPEIAERKKAHRRLRIWSAGCSTGAEAYSVAILVRELLGERLKDWGVSIVGTDINDNFLDIARSGRFGPWALRSLTPEQKAAYFLQTPEREQWQLRPEFRSLVRFERHNLLSLLNGTSPLQFTDFDLILCRNVLIYFHPATVNRIVEALRDTLSEAGWMLVGHAEPNPSFAEKMLALGLPGTTAYRNLPPSGSVRQSGPEFEAPEIARKTGPVQAPQGQPARPVPTRKPRPAPVTPPPPASAPIPPGPDASLALVRELADAGALDAAAAACERSIAHHPVDPILHFYRGLIAQARQKPAEAEKAFLDSIYLDKNFVMAHYHLGLHLMASGKRQRGFRSIANAARIAAALPPDRALVEADGLIAGEFKLAVRTYLAQVPDERQ